MQLKMRGLEEHLNRELMLHGQRLEVIDSSTKAALLKHGEKYQAACELGTRTLLLEKAVKWLLEVGLTREKSSPPPVSRSLSAEMPVPQGAAETVPWPPPPSYGLQRMFSA